MLISDIMTKVVRTLTKDSTLAEAATVMREFQIGSIVVVKEKGGRQIPVGVLTDRDIVVEVVSAGVNDEKLTVEDVMSREIVTIPLGASLMTAVQSMERNGVRRLPVVDEKGSLCGIITADDISAYLASALHKLSKVPGIQKTLEEQVCELTLR